MRKIQFTREWKATTVAASFMAAIIITVTMVANGCGKADEIFDCEQVCTRYKECYNSGYDVDSCRSRCRTNSDNNASIRNDANECEACIGDKSCLSATFTCAVPCGTIVP